MRLRSKALLAVSAVAFIRCSAPLIEDAHAQERPAVTVPVLPAQTQPTAKPEQDAKPEEEAKQEPKCTGVTVEEIRRWDEETTRAGQREEACLMTGIECLFIRTLEGHYFAMSDIAKSLW